MAQTRLAGLASLARNKRPGIDAKRHFIEISKYARLAFAGNRGGFNALPPPASSVGLDSGSRWDHFSHELRFTVGHIHPRHYLRAPVVARTTANPARSPTARVTPTCWAEETVRELAVLLSAAYPAATPVQWENLLAKSQCTTEWLFKAANLDPSLYRDTTIIELGSGFGAHSYVNAKRTTSRAGNVNFDLPEMLALQQNVVRYLRSESGDNALFRNLRFTSDHSELFEEAKRGRYAVVSHYAFTEFSMKERARMTPLIAGAAFVCLVANESYEGVRNREYIAKLADETSKAMHTGPVCNPNDESHTRTHTAYLLV